MGATEDVLAFQPPDLPDPAALEAAIGINLVSAELYHQALGPYYDAIRFFRVTRGRVITGEPGSDRPLDLLVSLQAVDETFCASQKAIRTMMRELTESLADQGAAVADEREMNELFRRVLADESIRAVLEPFQLECRQLQIAEWNPQDRNRFLLPLRQVLSPDAATGSASQMQPAPASPRTHDPLAHDDGNAARSGPQHRSGTRTPGNVTNSSGGSPSSSPEHSGDSRDSVRSLSRSTRRP
jgi:hypothetical protein